MLVRGFLLYRISLIIAYGNQVGAVISFLLKGFFLEHQILTKFVITPYIATKASIAIFYYM